MPFYKLVNGEKRYAPNRFRIATDGMITYIVNPTDEQLTEMGYVREEEPEPIVDGNADPLENVIDDMTDIEPQGGEQQ